MVLAMPMAPSKDGEAMLQAMPMAPSKDGDALAGLRPG